MKDASQFLGQIMAFPFVMIELAFEGSAIVQIDVLGQVCKGLNGSFSDIDVGIAIFVLPLCCIPITIAEGSQDVLAILCEGK